MEKASFQSTLSEQMAAACSAVFDEMKDNDVAALSITMVQELQGTPIQNNGRRRFRVKANSY
jgi:hypothetical protein